jgi:multiple sugar transport system permease protein
MKHARQKCSGAHSGLPEGWLAFLLILPAVLVILGISVYPIARTIWYSLFDLRLNHPTRSTTHFSYSLDVEQYCDGLNSLRSQLRKALSKSEDADEKTEIEALLEWLESSHEALFADEDHTTHFDAVQTLYDNFESVSDDALRYMTIAGDQIAKYADFRQETHSATNALAARDSAAQKALKKAAQAVDTLDFALVEPNFTGFGSYSRFFQDSRLWTSVANTVIFSFTAVAFELCVGLMLAMVMNRNFRGRGLVRASVLIPWSIPASTSALIWKFMYDGQYGVMAKLFATLGIISSPAVILTTRAGSLFGMIVSDIWKTSPFMALLLLAGLQTIDASLYEAAKVDGSTSVKSFFRITLPLLRPTILVAVLFRTMDTFKAFDLPSVMTYGANNTEFISLYSYKLMFAQMDFGSGATISIILFFMVFLLCMFYIKVLGADLFSNA